WRWYLLPVATSTGLPAERSASTLGTLAGSATARGGALAPADVAGAPQADGGGATGPPASWDTNASTPVPPTPGPIDPPIDAAGPDSGPGAPPAGVHSAAPWAGWPAASHNGTRHAAHRRTTMMAGRIDDANMRPR